MGKFSKALEKAKKQTGVKPSWRSTVEHGPPNAAPNVKEEEPPVKSTLPAPSKDQPVPTEPRLGSRVAAKPINKDQASVTSDQRDPVEPHLSPDQPVVEASTEVCPAPHPSKHTEPEPVSRVDAFRKPEGTNISFLKPEISETTFRGQAPPAASATLEDNRESAEKVPATISMDNVQVMYSRTQVQANDPQRLIENKVLSVFENFETTNQFKLLRTQVLRKLKVIGGNSILVTSANPYEGKTFTSINLGVSIAKEFDRTVLIIDADIRRPTRQHTDFSTSFFSLKIEKGLSDYLEGSADIEEILINPGIDKLTLIPGGIPVDNSPELLNSSRMRKMMQEIKNRYPADRLVIVDGPAFLHFPDALILNRYVDGVLPVVEAEKTAAEDLKKMMKNLSEFNILGVVLNKKRG
jgi:non-specific protein-tyrosine kinase